MTTVESTIQSRGRSIVGFFPCSMEHTRCECDMLVIIQTGNGGLNEVSRVV